MGCNHEHTMHMNLWTMPREKKAQDTKTLWNPLCKQNPTKKKKECSPPLDHKKKVLKKQIFNSKLVRSTLANILFLCFSRQSRTEKWISL